MHKQIILALVSGLIAFPLAVSGAGPATKAPVVANTQASATLEVNTSEKAGATVTDFTIDTGTRVYQLTSAARPLVTPPVGPRFAYGMRKPNGNWFDGGMVDVSPQGRSMADAEVKVQVLKTEGPLVAYDLLIDGQNGAAFAIRTVALAGRDELFLAVYTSPDVARFSVSFHGYPCGYGGQKDRWVHVEGSDIQNEGDGKYIPVPLDLDKAPWILMTDHLLNEDGGKAGQLGLAFRKSTVEKAFVTHVSNYRITASFSSQPDTNLMEFILSNFDPMTWEEARTTLAASARQSDALLDQAFKQLPPPSF